MCWSLLLVLAFSYANMSYGSSINTYCRDSNKADGNYRNPSSCTTYIACLGKLTYIMPCYRGLYYNSRTNQCDYPSNVPECSDEGQFKSPICKDLGLADGNYCDPSSCTNYIACLENKTYIKQCDSGQYYSSRLRKCDDLSNVPECPAKKSQSNIPVCKDLDLADGNYLNPSSCTTYIACSEKVTYIMSCPSGLFYNSRRNQCDYPSNVPECSANKTHSPSNIPICKDLDLADGNYRNPSSCLNYIACSGKVTYIMPCPSGLFYNSRLDQCDYPSNVPECSTNKSQSKIPVCKDLDLADGNYLNPSSCTTYIACSGKVTYIMSCSSGLFYNSRLDQCDYPSKVPECSANKTHSPSNIPICKDLDLADGNYRNPSSCTNYIACSGKVTYIMPCPSGLFYNSRLDKCDYPSNVPECSTNKTQSPSSITICKDLDLADGNYCNPSSCASYIACSGKLTYIMPCPRGLYFNSRLGQCDFPSNVPECALNTRQ